MKYLHVYGIIFISAGIGAVYASTTGADWTIGAIWISFGCVAGGARVAYDLGRHSGARR